MDDPIIISRTTKKTPVPPSKTLLKRIYYNVFQGFQDPNIYFDQKTEWNLVENDFW